MIHSEAPRQFQVTIKRPKSEWWPNSWKSLPLPQNSWNNTPTHESESFSVVSNSLGPMGFSRPEYWNGYPFHSPWDLPNPGIKPRSPTLQTDSLPAEPQGKPKHTEVGSLSFLQGIFPTQELNQGLLHCRWILYQLSYEGSPTR